MELDLKKPLIILAVLVGIGYYVATNYTLRDVLTYARKHPDPRVSPAVDYYVGMGYYTRSDYGSAASAFTQLLTDYPTCQYAEPALFRLGDTQERALQFQDAHEAYEKYLDQFPNGPEHRLVQGRLDALKSQGR